MSNSVSISLGMQCTTAAYLKDTNRRSHSFPFDWMLAPPTFVFEMLRLLLRENMDPLELVVKYFYALDKKVTINLDDPEHYKTTDDVALPNKLNSRYDAIFPHDYSFDQDEVKRKYARRFQRLKDLILNKDIALDFFYVSQSSGKNGNFTIDCRNVVVDVFNSLRLINDLMIDYHGQSFRIIVFDTLRQEDPNVHFVSTPNVHVHYLEPKNKFFEMFPQMMTINVN